MTDIERIRERIQAEQLAPASIYVPPQLYTPVHDTISKADAVDSLSPSTRTSRPILDPPKPLELETFVKGREGMKNLLRTTEEKPTMDVDDMLHEMLLSIIQQSSNFLQVVKNFFDSERTFSDMKEKERSAHITSQVETGKTIGKWDTVEKSLVSFGLIAAGIAGIATGNIPLGVTAIVVGTLLAADQILEDRAKIAVSSWIARGDQEQERIWLERIQILCAATSLGLSLGLGGYGAVKLGMGVTQSFIQLGMVTAKGVASSVKSVNEWRYNVQRSVSTELDLACTVAQKSVNRVVFDIQEICNTLYQLYENMHQVEEKREQIARLMVRLPNM